MHVGLVVFNDVDYGLDLANALHEVGQQVTLYLSHKDVALYMGTRDRPEERLRELGLVPETCQIHIFRLPRIRDPRSAGVVRRISRQVHDDGIDMVHILMGPGELWVATLSWFLRSLPVTSTLIIPKPNIGGPLPPTVTMAISRLLVRGSDLVIVNGADQVSLVTQLYGVPAKRIEYIPLGPRTTALKWLAERHTEEPGTVLFFGKVAPHKGLEYLVRAQPIIIEQVPHARILIAGRGDGLEACRPMIQDNGGFQVLEGFIPGETMGTLFQRASLVALPYLSSSTSGILVTAYVFGRPVVATRVGSLPEYVEEGVTGLLVNPADVEGLAQAIIQMLQNDDMRHQMGHNARDWADGLRKTVTSQTLDAYRKAIALHDGKVPGRQAK